MSSTERPLQRDRERTRAQILGAAEELMQRRGAQASLADIAQAAGVTKSGLMHHFKSREELLAGLVSHVLERLWEEVLALVDISENTAGKLTRAYVRAMTGDSQYVTDVYCATGLFANLGSEVGQELLDGAAPDDPIRWNQAFENDGLSPALAWTIRYAAEGVAMGINTPYVTPEQLRLVREQLLAMTVI